MNHLANPLSLRLGIVKFWNSISISANKKTIFNSNLQDITFHYLFLWFFKYNLLPFGFIFSHIKIIRTFRNVFQFLIFFYNAEIEKFWRSYYYYFNNNSLFQENKIEYLTLILKNYFKQDFLKLKKLTLKRKKNIYIKLYNIKNVKKKQKKKKLKLFFLQDKKLKGFYKYLSSLFLYKLLKIPSSINLIQPFIKTIFVQQFLNLKKKIYTYFLKFRFNIKGHFSFSFYQIFGGALNANVVCNYLITKLKQRFKLFRVVDPLLKTLTKLEILDGFKISCSGRFTRKQIATYYWEKKGNLPLNTVTRFVDYAFSTVILKNSICGIKVWLCHSNTSIKMKEFYKNASHLNSFYE